tara:strand:+ start:1712 stop:2743 length:1032 start_codon:yes stop_codon:yes gene_type:complete
MEKINIAINGFGRIGRSIFKIINDFKFINIKFINDINPSLDNLIYLLKYDSTYGTFKKKIENYDDYFIINKSKTRYFSEKNINKLFDKAGSVDILIDSTGINIKKKIYQNIIKKKQTKKVIITQSSDQSDREVVMGFNENKLEKTDSIISSSICDANAIIHILSIFDEHFGIKSGSVTTVHPWLSYQNLVDGSSISQSNPNIFWKDYALGRSSSNNLIPKNTTAIQACEKIKPNLKNKLLSFSYRVPTEIVSSSDITLFLEKNIKKDQIDQIIKNIEKKKFLEVNYESLVSRDFIKNESSAIIDYRWIKIKNNIVKIVLWYDNEWGYSNRVVDLIKFIYKKFI